MPAVELAVQLRTIEAVSCYEICFSFYIGSRDRHGHRGSGVVGSNSYNSLWL